MMGKVKYTLSFLLVTAAAYALSAFFLSHLDREVLKGVPLSAPRAASPQPKVGPPASPVDRSRVVTRTSPPPERQEDTSKKRPGVQEKPGLTSLNLKLLGTVVNEQGSSWAIIHDLDRDRQALVAEGYAVGEARVVSISKDRVLLNVNGKEEILQLGVERTKTASASSDQEGAEGTYVLNRETVKNTLDNLPGLMTQVRADVYFKDGKPEGFQVSQIQEGSLIKSAGFEEGDVIRSVNGQEVRSLEDAFALYQKFGNLDSFTVEILRGEKPKTLNVKIR
ncbi:MAG: type II secretion system protein N [Deltaproteobacteria bacterium]